MAVIPRVFVPKKPEQTILQIFKEEVGLERAISFTTSFVTIGNVLGRKRRTSIDDWREADSIEYPLRRTEVWDQKQRRLQAAARAKSSRRKLTPGKGEAPAELHANTSHANIRTVSLIRTKLWDDAHWSGTVLMTSPNETSPPVLAPLFSNAIAARQIFENLRNELGEYDAQNRLRISIIRQISRSQPHSYRVIFGQNLEAIPFGEAGQAILISRVHTMHPESSINLERFLLNQSRYGGFMVAHSVYEADSKSVVPVLQHSIGKKVIYVRNAWEIGKNDVDICGILPDDDPLPPPKNTNRVDMGHGKQGGHGGTAKWKKKSNKRKRDR